MRTTTKLLVAALAAFSLLACSDDGSGGGGGGWDIGTGEDGGVDAGPDAVGDTGEDGGGSDAGIEDYQVTFELKNDSGRSAYAYWSVAATSPCSGFGDQNWLSVRRDGQAVQMADDCSICNCDQTNNCAVCAMDCPGPPTASSAELPSGQSRRFEWDGRVWSTTSQGCESPELAAGETFEAEICYGMQFDDEAREIVDERCQTIDVTLDRPTQTVRVTIPAPETHDITFRMVNETGHDLYAYPGEATASYSCYGAWYSVGDGSTTYTLNSPCGLCECSQIEQNPDEQCVEACPAAMPCPAPTQEALRWSAGETKTDIWNGTITVEDQVANQSCERHVAPPVDQLVASFCWSESVVEQNGYADLGELNCQDVTFDRLADDVVEFRVQ